VKNVTEDISEKYYIRSPNIPHMKTCTLLIFALVVSLAICAGCTQRSPLATPGPTPEQYTMTTIPATDVPTPQPSFSLGDHYLKKSFSFQSEKDVYVEQVRVDNASWGIGFDILPLTENITDSWFTMKVTNRDTGQSATYGYGRTNGLELHHLIPMYTTGPYEVEMKGYRVKVDVILAKRNP
jgi:hypothetical protein